jgi:acyl-[acyl-carrier-protein] desaturase
MARAGVYSLRLHRDRVVVPLLRDWAIADVEGLDAEGREARDKLMALPDKLLRGAEVFEKRFKVKPA